ncbi:hypothetical protein Tco_1361199 [Tanacetum coccineum]
MEDGRNLQEEGLDEMLRNMMKDKSEVFKTPTQGKTSGEEDISPTTLEAAKTLSKGKDINTGFKDISTGFEDISTGFEDISTGFEDISTGFEDISTGFEEVNTGGLGVSTEVASLAEAIRLQTLEEEETAKQVHLDALLAKRLVEEEELTEQQKKRKAQVQFEAQFYTEEDWDAIRAKLEANAELTKDVLGKDLSEQDFAKRMVDLVNQLKKHFAEERAKLKKLKFEKIKEEFEKLVKQIDTFIPINIEATKAQLKRYGEELQTDISKKQRIDDKDVSDTEEKVGKVKEEEPVKRVGKRKKQMARKGERSIYQIIRANGADTVYMSFGAMLKDFTREDLIELYRLVMQKYGTNRPEDAYDRVLRSNLRTMFDPPLNEDAIWSLPLQKYPLSKDACQVMLKMKLLDGKMNEVCYKLLKMIEKQAGVKK